MTKKYIFLLQTTEKISATDIICSNFTSRISQTTSKEIEKNFLLPSNCPLSIPLVNSEFWRIMSSNQRRGDVKLATLQKSLVKVVAGTLNIFNEIQKDKFEIQTIADGCRYYCHCRESIV